MRKIHKCQRLLAWILCLGLVCGSGSVSYATEPVSGNDITSSESTTETEENLEETSKPVRGIYLTAYVAGLDSWMDEIIAHIDETEVNAVVIDVKNDNGYVVFDTDSELIDELGTEKIQVKDMPGLIQKLHEHDIYAIARIVTMRDPVLDNIRPEWMIHTGDDKVYEDKQGFAWIDPENKEAQNYLIEVALQCGKVGFDEVQFDYVRYPTTLKNSELGMNGYEKRHAIYKFVRAAHKALEKEQIPLSLDVFGTIISSQVDRNTVGQDYAWLSVECETLSPMIYPSHYANGSFGKNYPDLYPYDIINGAMQASAKELKTVNPRGDRYQASVRPWLQGFTASYLQHYRKYGADEVKAQIQAVYDNGCDSWIIWNPACKYSWAAFPKEEE